MELPVPQSLFPTLNKFPRVLKPSSGGGDYGGSSGGGNY
jgi:hypothetical protein